MSLEDGPLSGLRVLEFGQLLAGPYVGTLLSDFGADVVKIEAPGAGDAMRDWGRLRHNDHSLWWSVLARNKSSVTLNLREERGQEIAKRARGDRRRRARELPARHDGALGARPRGRARGEPRRDLRAGHGLRADRQLPRARGLRGRRRGDLRPALHQRLSGPGAAADRHLARGHARRAVGVPGHPARALRPRRARRGGPGGRRLDRRRLLRDDGVDRRGVREDGEHPTADGAAAAADRAVERLPAKDGKWVVIAANHDTLWKRLAKVMGHPDYADDPRFATTTPAARTRTCSTRSSARSPPSTRRPSSTRSSTRPAWCARRSTRRRTSTTTRGSASAGCSSRTRTRSTARCP